MSVTRNELQQQQSRAADQEQRANDLEQIMESVKSKIGEMEDESVNRVCQQQNKIKELQKEHKVLQVMSYPKTKPKSICTISPLLVSKIFSLCLSLMFNKYVINEYPARLSTKFCLASSRLFLK